MSPLELEMYHQIRNIIGVNPTFYEYMLQIDADTVVAADSATRFVSAFLDDTRLIACCGETSIANAKSSFITMIQVYEYYISHNLSKAFESLFGSVTCLPVVVSPCTVSAPPRRYKTKYIYRAHAWTIAPDSWKVFLSQRRRWINSTVHNLIELIPMGQLCGFCCFSMRFIVFIDLLSTIIQPVTIAYIVYLIVRMVLTPDLVPVLAFVLLAAVYGLQAIIFILRRKWEMIAWMILYIIAMPIFSFGKKVVVTDEGKFDPSSIPRKKWEEYQSELWDAQTSKDDTRSEASGFSYATKAPVAVSDRPGSTTGIPHMPHMPYSASRMSLAHSEMLMAGNRQSQFGGSQFNLPQSGSEMELSNLAGLPSDDALLAEIREILRTADLMTVTKKVSSKSSSAGSV
ncbi:hypothetical protein MCOR02_012477 [Pyricularia oryzae]|nr:hypothetical protein MCOR02_012477 [Pyricularia oryzae]